MTPKAVSQRRRGVSCSGGRCSAALLFVASASGSVPFAPPGSAHVLEPNAKWAFSQMRQSAIRVDGVDAPVQTSFYSTSSKSTQPGILFLHGGDSTCLEWRAVLKELSPSANCLAVDWWSGGWTARAPITDAIQRGAQPWDAIKAHLHAFWQMECGGRPVHLVGTSMGGAVALDFATSFPEAVAKLVLVDAGGESYAAPPPLVGKLLAPFCPVVLKALAWALPRFGGDAGALASLHRNEPGWQEAYVAYLGSGGYELRVGPELIRTVPQPTLVIWGANDPVLDPSDATAFARDLPHCAGVRMVANAGHSPHIDDPETTAEVLASFLLVDGQHDARAEYSVGE